MLQVDSKAMKIRALVGIIARNEVWMQDSASLSGFDFRFRLETDETRFIGLLQRRRR
jgi:hypothetical protein